jgi:hypothetical protein
MRYSVGELCKVGLAALFTAGGVAYIVLASVFAGRVGQYERAIGRILEPFIPGWLPGALSLALGVILAVVVAGVSYGEWRARHGNHAPRTHKGASS